MEFIKVLEDRRSIRKYQDKDINDELIKELLLAGLLCQSVKNRQPWLFGVLRGKEKNNVADLMLKWCDNANLTLEEKTMGHRNSARNTANVIKQAPVLILVFRESDNNWITGDTLSIGAAIEHICLRATDLGLGSLWIRDTVYVEKEICKLVNHSELELLSTITIGYADESPNQRPRKDLENLVVFYDKQ